MIFPRSGENHGTAKEKGFEEPKLGNEQRPIKDSPVTGAWENMKYGDPKGK